MSIKLRVLLLFVLGHLATDTTQGALPALLPFLKESLDLSYAAAGVIVMTMNLTSSVIQPLFGYLTDRLRLRWLVPAGVALAGVGFAAVGLMPNYALVLVAVTVCGLGVASFHPESFKSILASAGERKVTAVSWFMVGGNLGMALGPLLLTVCLAWQGMKGTVLFALPAWIMAGVLLLNWGLLKDGGPGAAGQAAPPAPQPLGRRWRPLSLLLLAVTLRSWAQFGVSSYLPFYFLHELGGDPLLVGHLLTTYLFCGAAGTLAGAPVADRVGPKPFFIVSLVLVTPVMAGFLYADQFWLFIAVGVAGALLMSTWSTVMVMAQQLLPDRAGMASGLMVGFAVGAGGMGATALGWVADNWGLPMVMGLVAAMPALSALVAWRLPGRAAPQAAGRAA